MRILVTFAVEAEFAPWRALRAFKKARVNPDHWSRGLDVYEAQVGDHTVWVLLTGIGIKSFDFAIVSCLRNLGVSLVVSSGLAGSLNDTLLPGEIFVPRRLGTLRDASGIQATTGVVAFAEHCGAKSINTLLTADRLIATKEEKSRLASFGEAVDMESFALASEILSENVPVAAIRAISDGSKEDLPLDFGKCLTPQGQLKLGPMVKELFGHPTKASSMVRFGKQSRNAAQRLAEFLDRLVQHLTPGVLSSNASEVAAI